MCYCVLVWCVFPCAARVDICVPCHCAPWSGSWPTGRCSVLIVHGPLADNTVSGATVYCVCEGVHA